MVGKLLESRELDGGCWLCRKKKNRFVSFGSREPNSLLLVAAI